MAELGIRFVRIGEFAWSRLEPRRGKYDFGWLKKSIDILHAAGLKVVLGTPTATPPKWLVDAMPDMLPVGADGKARGFGSRRHYDFSHEGHREACKGIVTAMAKEFGQHPGVAAWQTDNEYDCHNTTLSYSDAARRAFRDWLARRYQSPDALNRAWGNVFWSMEYASFEEVELPNLAVTRAQPGASHGFPPLLLRPGGELQQAAGRHHPQALAGARRHPQFHGPHAGLRPLRRRRGPRRFKLGFLSARLPQRPLGPADEFRQKFIRAGDPDFQAFHHDLYRSTSAGRWWIMEQQPGPVNWARTIRSRATAWCGCGAGKPSPMARKW